MLLNRFTVRARSAVIGCFRGRGRHEQLAETKAGKHSSPKPPYNLYYPLVSTASRVGHSEGVEVIILFSLRDHRKFYCFSVRNHIALSWLFGIFHFYN